MTRLISLILTLLTGFTGLVYQVAWQKYLATLLGSHAEATAAVLGIFLGGLALGYHLFGRMTRRRLARAEATQTPPRLLVVYGLVEMGIGGYAAGFPLLFQLVQEVSYAAPHAPEGLGFAIDVILAAILIGPPTLLMGGTIPILTQALARSLSDATRFHALVYAVNTLGAFAGALAAAFFLAPRLGLVGVMLAMAVINVGAGAVFILLGLRAEKGVPAGSGGSEQRPVDGLATYAGVALLIGFGMMTVQTTVIRLAGLAFGSSEFTFSMVVAAFVLCIALGSLVVSALPRIRRSYVIANLWALAVALYALYGLLPQGPYWIHLLRGIFRDEPVAFHPYYFMGFLAVLAAIAPPVLLSGAALPLLFHHLRRHVGQLGSVAGELYGWNTLGSLLGALLGGYALLFWLDLHHVYRIAVAALFLAALALTMRLYALPRLVALALLPLVASVSMLAPWDPRLLSLGLLRMPPDASASHSGLSDFLSRYPELTQEPLLYYYDDDPTTSVGVREHEDVDGNASYSLWTNGKSDGHSRGDYQTMGLAAVLPAMLAEKVERAFVVGYGLGISAGELSSLESTREVIVAEISHGVVQAAPLFDVVNQGASTSPKLRIVRSDAYRALMRVEGSFDVIVSEPSHPWVAGVEMLFSREFLAAARERLTPGGVYAQWLQQYSIDDASIALVLRTYAAVFEHVAVWTSLEGDLLLLGFERSDGVDLSRLAERAKRQDFAAALERSGVTGLSALLAHEAIPLGVVHAAKLEGPLHTLLHPRLSYMAGRAFFLGRRADLPFLGFGEAARVGSRNSMHRSHTARLTGPRGDGERAELIDEACRYRHAPCVVLLAAWQRDAPESPALAAALERAARRKSDRGDTIDRERLAQVAALLEGDGPGPRGPVSLEVAARASDDFVRLYQHATPFDAQRLVDIWSRCQVDPEAVRVCQDRLEEFRTRSHASEERIEELGRRCRSAPTVRRLCHAGLERARALAELR